MVSGPEIKIAWMIGDGLGKGFVSWWLDVRKNLEHHARFTHYPLAYRSILAGIKTSAVINIGTATLGALTGAGGYGRPILTGVRLDNIGLILQGAIPAAALALLAQGAFELAERWIVP